MKEFFFFFSITLFLSFQSHPGEGGFKVAHKGALKNIMHQGDLSAKGDLKDLEQMEHVYALGAVEDLKGEILVMDSKPFVSSVEGNELVIRNDHDHKATLLVYVSVSDWQSIQVPSKIKTYADLEEFVEKRAKKAGINVEEPFPFLLEGNARSFEWHVINWPEGDTEHSHEKHISSGLHGKIEDREVEILGFYSRHHHAVFTHHTTNMHLHVKTKDEQLAGHMDGLELGRGMILKLPAVE